MFACVGITTTDLFNSGIEKMPEFGGNEFTVNNLAFCDNPLQLVLGGNGAIAAFVLARLGAPVALCSAIGKDLLGDMIEEWLIANEVNTAGLYRTLNAATPTTTVMTDAALNRISFHHAGASTVYEPANLPIEILDAATILLLSSFTLLPKWRPNGFAQVAATAKMKDAVTLLDIGPAIGQVATLEELTEVLPNVDYFICNDHELCTCVDEGDLPTAMKAILDAGASAVITKQGEEGASVLMAGQSEPTQVAGFAVDAHFTVGAGDSFNAGFMFALQQGNSVYEAVRFANGVAALVVSAAQGSLGAPTLDEAQAFLNNLSD